MNFVTIVPGFPWIQQRHPQIVGSLGLRVSVQLANPALPIRLLGKQLPKVYVLPAHKIFMTFCALFPNRISRFKILAMPWFYVLCPLLTRIQESFAFSVVWK